jgi:hypothetical protein
VAACPDPVAAGGVLYVDMLIAAAEGTYPPVFDEGVDMLIAAAEGTYPPVFMLIVLKEHIRRYSMRE